MPQQTNIVEDSYERLQEAVESVGDEINALQKRFDKNRKRLEKDTRKRVQTLQKDLRKSPLFKRAEKVRKDANKQFESFQKDVQNTALVKRAEKFRTRANKRIEGLMDDVLSTFQIATRSDVDKLDRRLKQINKKLREIESKPAARKRAA